MTASRRPGVRAVAACVATLAMVLAGACGGDSSDGLPDPVAPRESETGSSPTVDPEHEPILTAYENFVRAADEAANAGDPDHPALSDYAGGVAEIDTRNAIERNGDIGVAYAGSREIVSAEVTDVDRDPPPDSVAGFSAVAELTSCLDLSDYLPVAASDGSPMHTGDVDERFYVSGVTLGFVDDRDRWLVIRVIGDWETSC